MNNGQQILFNNIEDYDIQEREWQDMPEFIQERQKPFAIIIVRFETEDDLKDFEKRIDQKLTQKTQSIWHPFKSHWGGENTKKRWKDGP